MKPIVIIVISVVCSVGAVLAVLVGLQMYAVNEAQKAYAIELERQEVCEVLYGKNFEVWEICINEGITSAVGLEVSRCRGFGPEGSYTNQKCVLDTKINSMNVVNDVIKLDKEFRNNFTYDLNNLVEERFLLMQEREKEAQEWDIIFREREIIKQKWRDMYTWENTDEWESIYEKCLKTDIPYFESNFLHKKLCNETKPILMK